MTTPRLPTQFEPEISHQIERLAARAWPAAEVEDVEGWLLRRTVGVERRRSNSLLPPSDAAHAARTADLALATAEERGIAPVVQVSPAESHLRLDETLDARGMALDGPSLVLAGPLRCAAAPEDTSAHHDSSSRSAPGLPCAAPATPATHQLRDGVAPGSAGRAPGTEGAVSRSVTRLGDVAITLSALTLEWVRAWARVSGITGTQETANLVLSQLGDRARFAIAADSVSHEPLAVGIGVVEEHWLGLFSLATTPTARRRGIASAVVDTLEHWAASRDSRRTYLQVEAANVAALTFYAARGFHIAHSYHYRSA